MPKFVTSIAFDREFLDIYEKLRDKAREEGMPLGVLIQQILAEWAKKHLEGNPGFSMDKWLANPEFQAYPATLEPWSEARISSLNDDEVHKLEDWFYRTAMKIESERVDRARRRLPMRREGSATMRTGDRER